VKYDMAAVTGRRRALLVSLAFLETVPVRVFDVPLCSVHATTCGTFPPMKTINIEKLRGKRWARPRICDASNITGSQHNTIAPPKLRAEFVLRAEEELQSRATTEVIFSLKFLMLFCTRARLSTVRWQHPKSFIFLEGLKGEPVKSDVLPFTI
jgi:hypothetical protein